MIERYISGDAELAEAGEVPQLVSLLRQSYQSHDDQAMRAALSLLCSCKIKRIEVTPVVFESLLFQSWDRDLFPNRQWRDTVRQGFFQLYNLPHLFEQLDACESKSVRKVSKQLKKLFTNPAELVKAAMENRVLQTEYCENLAKVLDPLLCAVELVAAGLDKIPSAQEQMALKLEIAEIEIDRLQEWLADQRYFESNAVLDLLRKITSRLGEI